MSFGGRFRGDESDGGDDPSCTFLKSRDLEGICQYIESGLCENIAILTGAGVSVSAGIPDYRSAGGFYETLDVNKYEITEKQRQQLIEQPEYMYNINFFRENPKPMWKSIAPMYLEMDNYHPTLTHYFCTLLAAKSFSMNLFTQNIDSLHSRAGFPDDCLYECHGTLRTCRCNRSRCKMEQSYTMQEIRDDYCKKETVPVCEFCEKGHVRPNVVLFGEDLPQKYYHGVDTVDVLNNCDLLFVIGTSLEVYPVCTLIQKVPDNCVRVLMNMEKVGEAVGFFVGKNDDRDVFLQGSCDKTCKQICERLGWDMDLIFLMEAGERSNETTTDLMNFTEGAIQIYEEKISNEEKSIANEKNTTGSVSRRKLQPGDRICLIENESKIGVIQRFIRKTKCWRIKMEDGSVLKLKSENLKKCQKIIKI